MVVVKFLVFVSEVVSIFSKILTWIIGGQKDIFAPPTQLLGVACPSCPPKSTPMTGVYWQLCTNLKTNSHATRQFIHVYRGALLRSIIKLFKCVLLMKS